MVKRIVCKLCQKKIGVNNFNRHLMKYHEINAEEYYNTYIDISPKICKAFDCQNTPCFISIVKGYSDYCSLACCYKKGSPRNQVIGDQKRGKTYEEMYGVIRASELKKQCSIRDVRWFELNRNNEKYLKRNKKISLSKIGIPRSDEVREKCRVGSIGKSIGKNNGNWKGGRTALSYLITESVENKVWRQSVLDYFGKCFICDSKKRLQVHHLDSLSWIIQKYSITKNNWREFKNVLFNSTNGVVLCYEHHNANNGISFHSVLGRLGIRKEHFLRYLDGFKHLR